MNKILSSATVCLLCFFMQCTEGSLRPKWTDSVSGVLSRDGIKFRATSEEEQILGVLTVICSKLENPGDSGKTDLKVCLDQYLKGREECSERFLLEILNKYYKVAASEGLVFFLNDLYLASGQVLLFVLKDFMDYDKKKSVLLKFEIEEEKVWVREALEGMVGRDEMEGDRSWVNCFDLGDDSNEGIRVVNFCQEYSEEELREFYKALVEIFGKLEKSEGEMKTIVKRYLQGRKECSNEFLKGVLRQYGNKALENGLMPGFCSSDLFVVTGEVLIFNLMDRLEEHDVVRMMTFGGGQAI